MNFIINYWYIILIIIAAISVGGYMIYNFIKMPSGEQMKKVKEWLLYAVAEAEKELGGGTGEIKLRYVYDMFITKFPYLSKIITFEAFSSLVDEVLEEFKEMLKTNNNLDDYINGDN